MKAISRDGTPIAYERAGSGPALILVDGALCSRAFGPMPKLAPLLAPTEYRVPAARFATIAIPALAMHGGKTDVRLQQAARAVADAIPGAQHRTLDGQTHNVSPAVLPPAVVEFFTA
jgi:pimeloyl-ACP methyl ester carboxylesterase